jgi:menaquinone-9 beta-reductase
VGLVAAIEATLRGMSVVVVEPRTPPVDKACGEGLMPGAVAVLQRLGVEPAGEPFAGISYVTGDGRVRARSAFRAGPGLGVRRTTLHAALLDRAASLGVRTVRDRVAGLLQDGAGVRLQLAGGAPLDAPWVLGCDGLRSRMRTLAGVRVRSNGRRFGLRRHAGTAPWSSDVEVHWSGIGEAYVTPVAPDRVGIALLTTRGRDFCTTLRAFPALSARLDGVPWGGEVRGAGPLLQKVERRTSGRVLLVGDAAGYVDALTGEGLRIGFACAVAAVDAVRSRDPASYERRWRDLTRSYRWLTTGLVTATRLPVARAALVPTAAALPGLFDRAVKSLAG